MRLLYFLLSSLSITVAIAATASPPNPAALLSQFPKCALECVAEIAPLVGCSVLDIQCQCASKSMTIMTTHCMLANCTVAESFQLVKLNAAQCGLPHNSRVAISKALTLISGLTAFIMIALRIFARLWSQGRLWWDDWFHIAAGCFTLPLTTFANLCAFNGFGRHLYDVPVSHASELLRWFYLCQGLWAIAIILIKFSILSLYIRLFPQKQFHMAVYCVMAISFVAFSIPTTMAFLQCIPVRAIWDLDIKEKKCLDLAGVAIASAGANIATEIAIIILPVPMLKGLMLSAKKRVALYVLFGAGTLVIAIAAARIPYLRTLARFNDPTWDNVPTLLWSCAESTVAHVCAAAPAIRQLFSRVKATTKETNYYKRSRVAYADGSDGVEGIMTTHTTVIEKGGNVEMQPIAASRDRKHSNPPPPYGLTPQGQGFTTTTITADSGRDQTSPRFSPFSSKDRSVSRQQSDSRMRAMQKSGDGEADILPLQGVTDTNSASLQQYDSDEPVLTLPAEDEMHGNIGQALGHPSSSTSHDSNLTPMEGRSFLKEDGKGKDSWI